MADTPTRSLRAATNPQARMQELLSRDPTPTPAADELLPPIEMSGAVADTTGNIDSSAVAQTTDSADSNAVADATGSKAAQTRRRKHSSKERSPFAQTTSNRVAQTTGSAVGSATRKSKNSGGDPVREAMLGMLAEAYPEDMQEGAMTVTSVKIPRPIWERLEYARTITKRDKQDIIAEALRLYFEKIVQGETE